MLRFISLSPILVLLFACGGPGAIATSHLTGEDDVDTGTRTQYADEAAATYGEALVLFRKENCEDAIPAFKKVRRQYSYSRYAALSELRAADCLMIEQKWAEAIQGYRSFVRARPSHAEVAYAQFRIAQAYFEQIPTDFVLSAPAPERDQASTRDALRQLRRFMLDYPDDSRVPEAERMVRDTMALLARHELYVAEFNMEHDHPEAAARRLHTLLQTYRGSGLEPQAMYMLAKVQLNLEQREQAIETFRQLAVRYEESGYAIQARAYLTELGVPLVAPEASEPSPAPAAAPASAATPVAQPEAANTTTPSTAAPSSAPSN